MWWSDEDYSPKSTLLREYREEKEYWKFHSDVKLVLVLEKETKFPEHIKPTIFLIKCVLSAICPQLSEWHP